MIFLNEFDKFASRFFQFYSKIKILIRKKSLDSSVQNQRYSGDGVIFKKFIEKSNLKLNFLYLFSANFIFQKIR